MAHFELQIATPSTEFPIASMGGKHIRKLREAKFLVFKSSNSTNTADLQKVKHGFVRLVCNKPIKKGTSKHIHHTRRLVFKCKQSRLPSLSFFLPAERGHGGALASNNGEVCKAHIKLASPSISVRDKAQSLEMSCKHAELYDESFF
jgi:hypothetical protein